MGTLGDLFQVERGTVTGNRSYFVMNQDEARERALTTWATGVVVGTKHFPKVSPFEIRKDPQQPVVIALPLDIDHNLPPVRQFLADLPKRKGKGPVAYWHFKLCRPPIMVKYTGKAAPLLILNPDRLVVLNSLYCLYPKTQISDKTLADMVNTFNDTNGKDSKSRFSSRLEIRDVISTPIPASLERLAHKK